METNKLIAGIVAAAIAVIVLAGVLMPALSNATTTHETFTNAKYYTMDKIDESTNVNISWSKSTPNIITVDDDDIDMSNLPSGRGYSLIGSESLIVRYSVFNTTTYIEFLGDVYINDNTSSTITGFDVTINGDTVSYSDDRPYTHDYTLTGDSYYIVPDGGSYTEVMKDSTKSAYVKGDSEIHLIGTTLSNPIIGVYGSGTLDDGITLETAYQPDTVTTVTYGDVVATAPAVSGYEDLYSLEKFEFTIDYDGTTVDSTYTYFVVPAEVTAERTVHLTDAMNMILNVIPLLIIVAVLLGVVAVFILRRE